MGAWNDAVLNRDDLYRMKRTAVIREAGRAFSRKGFHGTSLEDIAKTLNVTKAALYHYVKSKDEILYECHKLALSLGEDALAEAREQGESGRDKLLRFLRSYVETLTGELGTCVVLTDVNSLKKEDRATVVQRRDSFDASMRAVLQEGIDDGSIAECDTKLVNMFIMGAVNWIPKWYSPEGKASGAEIAEAFVRFVERGLAPASEK